MTDPTAPPRGTVDPPTGRRELNKVRTREAVAGSLQALLRRHPVAEITVDQVAEGAGISRRTFFNYYAGLPAVLVEVFSGHAEQMVARVDTALLARDPLQALRRLVAAGGVDPDFLGWMVALNAHGPAGGDPTLERAVWTELGAWFETRLRDLFPEGTDPLYLTTLAASVMHAFAAAEQEWLAGPTRPASLTPQDLSAFGEYLDRALGHLARGWRPTSRS